VTKRRVAYLIFCLWLFIVTPGVRRYVDLTAGYSELNPLLLAPWLATSFSLVLVPRALRGPDFKLSGGILLVFFATTYGLTLAAFNGRAISGGVDWLRWTVPPCFGALVMLTSQQEPDLLKRLLRFAALSTALLGAYGLWQFLFMPEWDAFWMRNVDMDTIGKPEPYMVRVFSLLNSPGPLGNILSVVIIYLFAYASPVRIAALGVGSTAFLLSLNRSAWGALAVSMTYLVILGSTATKLRAILGIGAIALMMPVVLSLPEVGLTLTTRYESISNLSTDVSYGERMDNYLAFLRTLDENLIGKGFGITGTLQASISGQAQVLMDGQILEIFVQLGLLMGSLYLGGALYCVISAFMAGRRARVPLNLASSAVALATILLIPYGSPLVGESGIFFWLGTGLCFAPIAGISTAARR
jgi:hypothetical protein